MASTNSLRNINDIVNEILAETEREVAAAAIRIRQQAADRIHRIETNRMAFALLDAAGFDLDLPAWSNGASYTLDLGFFPSTRAGNRHLAERVRAVRLTLVCRLEMGGKEVADVKRKTVQFTLNPTDFPGIRIHYSRRLPKTAKCRIVKHRSTYTSLVCDV